MASTDAQSSPDTRSPEQERSFEAILVELQAIVEQLEGEDLPLEQSLRAFERGVALSRTGQAILDRAEQRIEVLLRDGTSTEPLDAGDTKPTEG